MPTPIDNKSEFPDKNDPNNESGNGNTQLLEPKPIRCFATHEKTIEGRSNSFIVLGRDYSKYGNLGHMGAGCIEICAGAFGTEDPAMLDGLVKPNNTADSAKIYISQKSDIDKYFNLVNGKTPPSEARSAIAMKADDIRIISRNTIKLVTNTDLKLSNNFPSISAVGVQIIANNDDTTLEPITKGDKLKLAFEKLNENLKKILGTIEKFMYIQRDFNYAIANHTHVTMFNGTPTSVSPEIASAAIDTTLQILAEVETDLRKEISNIVFWEKTYINPAHEDYINSKFNYVN